MRSVLAVVMCVALGLGCAPMGAPTTDGEESVGESRECQSTPFGQCEDLCYQIYLAEIVQCQLRYPPRQRPPCYAAAMERLGACLKRCK
jgi:hypothetical protein